MQAPGAAFDEHESVPEEVRLPRRTSTRFGRLLVQYFSREMTMARMHKLFFALLLRAVGELLLPGYSAIANAHEILTVEENGRWAEIESTRASLNFVRLVPVLNEHETVGIIAIYDNPMTARANDYLELRDDGGQIVAVTWFDRFGIRRLTLDRGFLNDAAKFERIFVTLVSGEPI